jgi:hypothetical protein
MAECPEQWKIDVNDKYQHAVGVVISLATGSMVLPILFLKDMVRTTANLSIADMLSGWVYASWVFLALSILSGIMYHYCSAKWVKQSWNRSADMFGKAVTPAFVEWCLDVAYFVMMSGFIFGLTTIVLFMVRFTSH